MALCSKPRPVGVTPGRRHPAVGSSSATEQDTHAPGLFPLNREHAWRAGPHYGRGLSAAGELPGRERHTVLKVSHLPEQHLVLCCQPLQLSIRLYTRSTPQLPAGLVADGPCACRLKDTLMQHGSSASGGDRCEHIALDIRRRAASRVTHDAPALHRA